MAECRTCGNTAALRVQTRSKREDAWDPYDICDKCGGVSNQGVPDVAYPYGSGTHTEENICYPKGHAQEGQPIPFSSKRGKMEAMKIAGIREAGDRVHGAINCQPSSKKKIFFT